VAPDVFQAQISHSHGRKHFPLNRSFSGHRITNGPTDSDRPSRLMLVEPRAFKYKESGGTKVPANSARRVLRTWGKVVFAILC
jgi:hypothetical protein